MLYVLIGSRGDVTREQMMEVYPEHKVLLDDYVARGLLIEAGPFLNEEGGSMGIFRSAEAAEQFSKEDPFTRIGAVKEYKIYEWKTVVGSLTE